MSDVPLSYYIDWTGLEDFDYDFDDAGLPRYDYGGRIGLKYNAITIAQWGLYNLQRWDADRKQAQKQQAFRCADWLASNAQPWKHDILAWVYDYGFDLYGPHPPWISGMAQGEAVSLLLRCHQLRGDEDYAATAHGAVRAFYYPFSEGGVVDYLPDGSVFFQEYPTRPPVHVLNGGVFALLGVYDYGRYFDDQKAADLARQGVETLKKHWRDWDVGFWTRYDLFRVRRLASTMYQELHVRQFRALASLFGVDEFNDAADRWQSMLRRPINRFRWAAAKIVEKIKLRLL